MSTRLKSENCGFLAVLTFALFAVIVGVAGGGFVSSEAHAVSSLSPRPAVQDGAMWTAGENGGIHYVAYDHRADDLVQAIRRRDYRTVYNIVNGREVRERMLGEKFDINDQDVNGRTYLHWAMSFPEAIPFLLEHGADPNIRDERLNTPFHWLAFVPNHQEKEVAAALLRAGGNPYLKNDQGNDVFQLLEEQFQWAVDPSTPNYIRSEYDRINK